MKMRFLLFALSACLFLPLSASRAAKIDQTASGLDSPNPAVRLEAVREIALDFLPGSLPLLKRAAGDEDRDVRERAVQALGLAHDPQVVEIIEKALGDPDEFVRWRAVQALERLGVQPEAATLASLIDDQSWRVKVAVCELLGTVGAGPVKNGRTDLPSSASGESIRKLLFRGLADRDERVRLAAASALARKKDVAVLGSLLELLKNGSMLARGAAGEALGELGDPSAIDPLIEAVADPRNTEEQDGRDWARWGAVMGLVTLSGQNFGADDRKWREWRAAVKPK